MIQFEMDNPVFEKNPMFFLYQNPFIQVSKIEFKTKGRQTLVQLLDVKRTVIKLLVESNYIFAGMNSVRLQGMQLQFSVYYIRIQNGIYQYIKTIIKI